MNNDNWRVDMTPALRDKLKPHIERLNKLVENESKQSGVCKGCSTLRDTEGNCKGC